MEHADAIAHFEELASVPANWRVNASSTPSTWRADSGAEIRHVDGAELDETTADVPPIAAGVMKVRPSHCHASQFCAVVWSRVRWCRRSPPG